MVIDATGVPEIGAQVALRSLLAGRHVGLLNVETDITVGWMLSRIAAQSGAVYTLVPRRRAGRGAQARRVRPRPRFDIVVRGQGQEQPPQPARPPPRPRRRGEAQADEPQDARELRRRLQGHDRDGRPGQRRRPGRQQARHERLPHHGARAARRVPARGRRRDPRPQRRGRLRNRPGGARCLRRRPQRRADRGRGDAVPRHGRRARTTPSTGRTTSPASRRRCRSRPPSWTAAATSSRARGGPRSRQARSGVCTPAR